MSVLGGGVASVEAVGLAKPEIDRRQHQSCAMGDRRGERPEPELGRFYARQRSRMAPVDEPEGAEAHHQQAGADPDLPLPIDETDQQRERQDHDQHREQMAGRERRERRHKRPRTFFHHPG